MKEEAIFLVGVIIGGMVISVSAERLDFFVALVIGIAIGLVFIIGFEIFRSVILKWLEKSRPTQ